MTNISAISAISTGLHKESRHLSTGAALLFLGQFGRDAEGGVKLEDGGDEECYEPFVVAHVGHLLLMTKH